MNSVKKLAFSAFRDGLRIAESKFCPKGGGNGIPVILSHGFLVMRRAMFAGG